MNPFIFLSGLFSGISLVSKQLSSILVVEDEKDIQNLVYRILVSNGFEVHRASSGEEGLVMASQINPDLIILDLMMPGLSGLEVCRLLKQHPVKKDIPIIILSALNRDIDKEYAEKAGADLYLCKPVDIERLLLSVDELLYKKM